MQADCQRSTACLCGTAIESGGYAVTKDQLNEILSMGKEALEADIRSLSILIAWWGAKCTCPKDRLVVPEPPEGTKKSSQGTPPLAVTDRPGGLAAPHTDHHSRRASGLSLTNTSPTDRLPCVLKATPSADGRDE